MPVLGGPGTDVRYRRSQSLSLHHSFQERGYARAAAQMRPTQRGLISFSEGLKQIKPIIRAQ